ncbi:hypothetical protein RJZ57_003091, partial [Blastomyces gilchristii]
FHNPGDRQSSHSAPKRASPSPRPSLQFPANGSILAAGLKPALRRNSVRAPSRNRKSPESTAKLSARGAKRC